MPFWLYPSLKMFLYVNSFYSQKLFQGGKQLGTPEFQATNLQVDFSNTMHRFGPANNEIWDSINSLLCSWKEHRRLVSENFTTIIIFFGGSTIDTKGKHNVYTQFKEQ